MSDPVGERFQRETRYSMESISGHTLDWSARPPGFKLYGDAPLTPLPPPFEGPPAGDEGEGLWSTIARRRSVRQFSAEPLTLLELSRLLWACAAVTRVAPNHLYRAAPSAGGLYPIETYVVAERVTDLSPGLHHYRVCGMDGQGRLDPGGGHVLEQISSGSLGRPLAQVALAQGMVAQAAAVFVWTAVFGRSRWKYRQRAYRYVYVDAGHIAAHLSLAAVALGLGSCQIGAFFDDEIDRLLGIDGEDEATVYLSAVGHPRE
jgi:SagB-type dehydrogenase family enzyme